LPQRALAGLLNQADVEARLKREDMGSEAGDEDNELISLSSNNEIDPNNPLGWENLRRRASNPVNTGNPQTYLTAQQMKEFRQRQNHY
jgi:hypothetical protein